MSRSPAPGASATILHAANRRIYGQWTSSHPQPLRRRAAQGAYRGRDDDDRRRKPVARAMVASAPTPSPISARRSRCAPATRGPGWQRASRAAASIPSRSASSKPAPPPSASATRAATDLALGQRVFHGKFGYGTIAAIEGNKLEIDFEHAGRKKVLDSFVSAG